MRQCREWESDAPIIGSYAWWLSPAGRRVLLERMSSGKQDDARSTVERLVAGAVGSGAVKEATTRALQARERAVELQELTMGALNLPSAAVIDRLARRVRSVSLRLEAIEDGLDRLEDRLDDVPSPPPATDLSKVLERLDAIEQRLDGLKPPGKAG